MSITLILRSCSCAASEHQATATNSAFVATAAEAAAIAAYGADTRIITNPRCDPAANASADQDIAEMNTTQAAAAECSAPEPRRQTAFGTGRCPKALNRPPPRGFQPREADAEAGMAEMSKVFRETGSELYMGAGGREHD